MAQQKTNKQSSDPILRACSPKPLCPPPPQPSTLVDCLLAQPCDACLGVVTFICKRNRRVDEALKRLDSLERLEESMATLTATNTKLLDRALLAEVTSHFFQSPSGRLEGGREVPNDVACATRIDRPVCFCFYGSGASCCCAGASPCKRSHHGGARLVFWAVPAVPMYYRQSVRPGERFLQ